MGILGLIFSLLFVIFLGHSTYSLIFLLYYAEGIYDYYYMWSNYGYEKENEDEIREIQGYVSPLFPKIRLK